MILKQDAAADWTQLQREALRRTLERNVDAEVRFDVASRTLYSTDASIYRIEPFGVVVPRTIDALAATVAIAMEHQVPLVPRGAGTSLSGQAIGPGLVLDCSKYLDRVIDLDLEARIVEVQPGCVLGQLNRRLKPLGYQFGPDVATIDRANLGGMIGNNSAGARSIRYGRTVDHVKAVDVVLTDGARATFQAVDPLERSAKLAQLDREGEIYRAVQAIVEQNTEEIARRYPKVFRRVSGYNLDALVPPADFNLAKIIVGSEGTLATVTGARLSIVPLAKCRGVAVIEFDSVADALQTLTQILTTNPSAVELLDELVLDLARASVAYRQYLDFLNGQPGAIFIVEYLTEDPAQIDDHFTALRGILKSYPHQHCSQTTDPQQCERIWSVRKTAMPLLYSIPGTRKPITFVEDTAVAPERLGEFVKRFRDILREHDTDGSFYGHASVGCLHIRPLLDIATAEGVRDMQRIAENVLELVLEFGGAMSGEHGDGLARSAFNPILFGPKIYAAFEALKRAFDPANLMNPGKIVGGQPIQDNLRTAGANPIPIQTTYQFDQPRGMLDVVTNCNGNGLCRRQQTAIMCPSYMATREERDSPRGRANLLRAVLEGRHPARRATDNWANDDLAQAFDLCLGCKACKTECPTSVDIAKLKSEFLHERHRKRKPTSLERLMARMPKYARLGSRFVPFSNLVLRSWLFRQWFYPLLGLDRRRKLPAYRRFTLVDWFRFHRSVAKELRGHVVLLADCFTNYHEPHIGRSAVILLEQAGFQVHLAPICCGRTAISKGFLDDASDLVRTGLRQLLPHVEEGRPILGLEPSCILALADEWFDLEPSESVREIARAAQMVESWLHKQKQEGNSSLPDVSGEPMPVLVHGHCHQKAAMQLEPTIAAIRDLANLTPTVLDSGCCGMAGSFGYEQGHYDVSVSAAEQRLLPAIREATSTPIIAPGFSCRTQILDLAGRSALHPVEILRRRISLTPKTPKTRQPKHA